MPRYHTLTIRQTKHKLNGRRQDWDMGVDMDMPVVTGTGPLLGWADSGDSRLSSTPSSGEEGGGRPTLKRYHKRGPSWHAHVTNRTGYLLIASPGTI